MKRIALFISLLFVIISCSLEPNTADRFKKGVFEIPAGENYSKTIITRVDSLQIEEYFKKVSVSTDSTLTEKSIKRIDTFYIKWLSNFAYSLRMRNPKTDLDKEIIFVQINQIKDSSYKFTTKIGRSDFKLRGELFISKK